MDIPEQMDIVSQVLDKAAKEADKFKPIHVEKPLALEIDPGTLLAFDYNDLDLKKIRSQDDRDGYLKDLARDNTQLLVNKIWDLPMERVEEAVVAMLPPPTFKLPREKPVPKPKPLTKWQKFAMKKGIKKVKKPKVTWDETLQKWIPRYGYKHALAEKQKNWLIPVPENADDKEDQFAKRKEQKKENVAKNEFQRLRNIAKAKNIKIPRVVLPPTDDLNSQQLGTAISVAKVSTASLGKFQEKLPKEKQAKNLRPIMPKSKKRKSESFGPEKEQTFNMNILDKIINKRPKLDLVKVVNRVVHSEQKEQSEEKKKNEKKGGRKPKKGRKRLAVPKNKSSKQEKRAGRKRR